MDDTTKGGNDKRSWRERLGIGTKDMPKISEDFKAPAPAREPELIGAGAATAKPEQKAPQPVARPAPMAPRSPAPMAPRVPLKPAGSAPTVNVTTSAPAPLPSRPVAPPPVIAPPSQVGLTPDALANRLKAQREAAEKLAEQRIQVARQRAEAAARAEQNAKAAAMPAPSLGMPNSGGHNQSGTSAKPKFTFAEDDGNRTASMRPVSIEPTLPPVVGRSPGIVPPSPVTLAPPRQPIGTERIAVRPQVPPAFNPPPPPNESAYASPYAPPPMTGYSPPQPSQYNAPYRPIDPVTGYAGPVPGSRPSSIPRAAPPSAYEGEGAEAGYTPIPPRPQRQVPLPPRQPSNYNDPDDIFEQPMRSPRRPTAGEYRQAYQEADMGFEDEPKRSSARWLLFLIPLAALAAAGLGIMFWQSNMRTAQVDTPAVTNVEEPAAQVAAPVVTAPETPVKADPEPVTPASTAPAQTPVAAPTKKQIYDRIVGDNEIPGSASLNPSEVQPIEPTVAPAQVIDPAAPALQDQGTGDAAPLPVPPPAENGTQGAIEPPPALPTDSTDTARSTGVDELGTDTAVASAPQPMSDTASVDDTAMAAASADAATQGIRPASTDPENATAIEDILPLPKDKVASTAVPVAASQPEQSQAALSTVDPPPDPGPKAPASSAAAAFVDASTQADATDGETSVTVPQGTTATDAAPVAAAPAETTIAESKPVVAKPRKVAAKPAPAKKVAAKPKAQSAEPVVLVAPGGQETAANTLATGDDGIYGAAPAEDVAQSAQGQTPKRRTLLELFNQQKRNQPTGQQVAAVEQPQQQAAPRRVAAPQVAATEPQASTGGRGFVAQLSSFRTQDEAQQEYQRIKSQHGAIVSGLTPVINETVVGGSKRYRLAVGTMQSNAAAGQVCSRLLAAGERDCLVRQR
jgi:SPOR domain